MDKNEALRIELGKTNWNKIVNSSGHLVVEKMVPFAASEIVLDNKCCWGADH